MSGEVAEAAGGEPSQSAALMHVIARAAADPTVNIDKMERLMALQERVMAKQAEVAFNEAMRNAQEECPKIRRNKRNQQTSSTYADLESVNDALIPVYTKHGFSLSFGTADTQVQECMRVTCKVSHVGGHSRDYQADVPLDLAGLKGVANKTRTHAFGSTASYGRRYLTLLIFNVSVTDEDDDGRAGGAAPRMTEAHTVDVEARCDSIGPEMLARVLRAYKVTAIGLIADSEYESIINRLGKAGGAQG